MIVCGIDVGIDGAVGFYGEELVAAFDLPTVGEDARREINVPGLSSIISSAKNLRHIFIENVSAMPSIPDASGRRRGMGAASAFRFGLSAGQIRAAAALSGVPYTLVVPRKWKKFFDLKGGDKEADRQMALRLIPQAAIYLTRKKDHQRADALLLAKWGHQELRKAQGHGQQQSADGEPAGDTAG